MALPTNAQDTVALLLDILPWLSINDIQSRISQVGHDTHESSLENLVDYFLAQRAPIIAKPESVHQIETPVAVEELSTEPPSVGVDTPDTTAVDSMTEQDFIMYDLPSSVLKKQTMEEMLQEVRKQQHERWEKSCGSSRESGSKLRGRRSPQHRTGTSLDFYNQVRQLRTEMHSKWRDNKMSRQRVWTMSDIERQRELEQSAMNASESQSSERRGVHTIENTIYDPEALDLTNNFRKANRLPMLAWHQALCDIGTKHSKDMAEKKVPFGHHGFHGRCQQFPFPSRASAENVAMNNGFGDVAVNGWIQSPGHRKNLLGKFSVCGIGAYQGTDGSWYLTQLFGLPG